MTVARRLALMVVVAVLVAVGCAASAAASTGAAAKSSRAARITAIVKRSVVVPSQVNGVVYGVWQHGHRIFSGALGKAQAGVAARPNMHVRIGNTAESMLENLLRRCRCGGRRGLFRCRPG
jgi:ABC-type Fe3+-hydroxamate transport system substrate-binding protein